MTIVLLVFLGGVLTILSPCILPVVPCVFARPEQRFLTKAAADRIALLHEFGGLALRGPCLKSSAGHFSNRGSQSCHS